MCAVAGKGELGEMVEAPGDLAVGKPEGGHGRFVVAQDVCEVALILTEEAAERDRAGLHSFGDVVEIDVFAFHARSSQANLSKKIRSSVIPLVLRTAMAASIIPGLPQR